MGSQTPPTKTRPPGRAPRPVDAGHSQPLGQPREIDRIAKPLRIPEKKVAMGPSGVTILGTVALIALGTFFWLKAPSTVAKMDLQKYSGFETNMDLASPTDCAPPGCLVIYLTTGPESVKAIDGAASLADQLKERGVETIFIVGQDQIKNCIPVARRIRRTVLFDPQGEWASEMKIEKAPYYVVYTPTAKVKARTDEGLTAGEVARALGL